MITKWRLKVCLENGCLHVKSAFNMMANAPTLVDYFNHLEACHNFSKWFWEVIYAKQLQSKDFD